MSLGIRSLTGRFCTLSIPYSFLSRIWPSFIGSSFSGLRDRAQISNTPGLPRERDCSTFSSPRVFTYSAVRFSSWVHPYRPVRTASIILPDTVRHREGRHSQTLILLIAFGRMSRDIFLNLFRDRTGNAHNL
jgi:hypothetical protein